MSLVNSKLFSIILHDILYAFIFLRCLLNIPVLRRYLVGLSTNANIHSGHNPGHQN